MKKLENSINKRLFLYISLFAVLGLVLLSVLFDFYYDLNDDVLIKDILSGLYTGIPEAHNNQILYPLSIFITALYRIVPNVPWFGLLEVLAFLLSYILIAYRFLSSTNSNIVRIMRICAVTVILLGCYLWELTNIQYTVVSGMLATTAAMWLYTSEDSTDIKRFLQYNIPTYILCFISFNLRSELFLLLTPMLAMIGLAKWSREPEILSRESLIKYLGTAGIIGLLMLISILVDNAAYRGKEWVDFREYFNARTLVYDITGIPDYDNNQAFYNSRGIAKEQVEALISYNWARDDSITTEMLNAIADYVESGEAVSNRNPIGITGAVKEYVYNAVRWDSKETDMNTLFADDGVQHNPMNVFVAVLYICTLLQALYSKDKVRPLLVWCTMVILRSIPWIYLYTTQRVITRITHPMYKLEITILLYMVFNEGQSKLKHVINLIIALIIIMSALRIPLEVKEVRYKQNMRQQNNMLLQEFLDIADNNPNTYYYVDVYSTVSFTERIFDDIPSKINWQLDGGWIARSPLDLQKQNARSYSKRCFATLSEGKDKWIISEIE